MQAFLYFLTIATGLSIIYVIAMFAIYNFGGWQSLELRFRATRKFRSSPLRIGTIALGRNHYKNSIRYGLSHEGLYIKPIFILIFHKPLFIRWADVEYIKTEQQMRGRFLELKLEGYKFMIGVNYFILAEMEKHGVQVPLQ